MIPQQTPVKNHWGNNSDTIFDFDFYLESEENLLVTHTSIEGVVTTPQLGIDYSITEIGNPEGSSITFPLPGSSYSVLAADTSQTKKELLTISLTLPIEQPAEYNISGELSKKNLEKSFDKLTQICQILARQLERTVKVEEGSAATPEELIESLHQAQLSAQNFANAAASSASSAQTSATSANNNATIATQKVTELNTLYSTASTDLTAKHQAAIEDMQDKKNDYNSNAASKTASLQQQFNDYTANLDGQLDAYLKNYDRLYQGVDLEVKFADEISAAGSVYTWLENRKNAGNFSGIHIGDYFHTNITAGTVAGYNIAAQNFKCRIVGINTYKSCADTNIGNMFYIMSDEVIDTPIKWNPTDNNNGTAAQNKPWLASAMYAILNGLNNYTTSAYGNAAHGANASAKGILQLLPTALQNVLKQKRNLIDNRYSASGLLTGSTGWDWGDMGKLWLPSEIEVYGCGIRSNLCQTAGFWFPEAGLSIQFPWFANNCEHRIKRKSDGVRCSWWLSSVASYNTTGVCSVYIYGIANGNFASNPSIFVPLCFCI